MYSQFDSTSKKLMHKHKLFASKMVQSGRLQGICKTFPMNSRYVIYNKPVTS